jgi:hypothetical protein
VNQIEVACAVVIDGWECRVRVTDQQGTTDYDVGIGELGSFLPSVLPYPGFRDMDRLVRETFEFLLEREPKESIQPRFNLDEVEHDFPEYRHAIRVRLAGPVSPS